MEKKHLRTVGFFKKSIEKIDEVLIWDDCSTDSTVKIIEKFISENKLGETWHLKINKENLGWRKNFFNLLNAATKEIVFTCDQDDIWDVSKIEVMCNAFVNTDVKVLVSDYTELVEPGGLAEELKKLIQLNCLIKKKNRLYLMKTIYFYVDQVVYMQLERVLLQTLIYTHLKWKILYMIWRCGEVLY